MSEKNKPFTPEDYQNPKELFNEPTLGAMVSKYLSDTNYKRSQEKSKERRENLRFYPSSLALTDRDIVLSMLGYIGTPQSGEGIMVMENGTAFHNRMEAMYEDMGIMIAPELSLKSQELCVSGRSDAIIWNFLREEDEPDGEIIELKNPAGEVIYKGPENYIMIVEFKSINDNQFHKLRKSKPKDAHEEQLQLYFHLTGITTGIVYYENKNTQRTKEYILHKDEEKIKEVTDRIKRLVECARNREIPEPEHAPTDIPALFSNFRDMTFPNSNPFRFEEIFEEPDVDIPKYDDVPF